MIFKSNDRPACKITFISAMAYIIREKIAALSLPQNISLSHPHPHPHSLFHPKANLVRKEDNNLFSIKSTKYTRQAYHTHKHTHTHTKHTHNISPSYTTATPTHENLSYKFIIYNFSFSFSSNLLLFSLSPPTPVSQEEKRMGAILRRECRIRTGLI